MKSPLVKESQVSAYIWKSVLKEKLLEKLSSHEIQSLNDNKRFKELYQMVNNLDD